MQSLSKQVRALGLMTGTSLDALDIACADFVQDSARNYTYEWVAVKSVPLPNTLRQNLIDVYNGTAVQMAELHYSFSRWVAREVNAFVAEQSLKNINIIGYHGQTIFHAPQSGYTFQLGNPGVIASYTGIDTVGDFRSQDVALGGQGAPLVPIGDALLFSTYDGCLNLGGIANISATQNKEIKAFDVCAFNLVMNHLAKQAGEDYDKDGNLASKGKVRSDLLESLNQFPFYAQSTAKSLGFEEVENFYIPTIARFNQSPQDSLATFTLHATDRIQQATEQLGLQKVLVTGGGAFNKHFIGLINDQATCHFEIGDSTLIEFKEALLFGFLAALRLTDEVNVLNSVTGATRSSVSGALYRGRKK